jgi:hypothetical protein
MTPEETAFVEAMYRRAPGPEHVSAKKLLEFRAFVLKYGLISEQMSPDEQAGRVRSFWLEMIAVFSG